LPIPGDISVKNAISWPVWATTLVVVVFSGLLYRAAAARLDRVLARPICLAVPLSGFPATIGGWTGTDTPLPQTLQRANINDDVLSRVYINDSTNSSVNLYIAYSARPRTMLGHRPDMCYPGAGWVLNGSQQVQFTSLSSKTIPGLIYRFVLPEPEYSELIVFAFYILNGKLVASQDGFSGIGWRSPNMKGDPARYVAQVQISSRLENTVVAAARDFADDIVAFFPDQGGIVRAAGSGESKNTAALSGDQ